MSVLASLGCTKDNPAFEPNTTTSAADPGDETSETIAGMTTDLSSGTGPATTESSEAATHATTGETPTTDPVTSSAGTSGTTSETTTGDDSTTGGAAPATCAEARDLGGTDSKVYTLAVPDMPGATTDVWCEQQVDGGGWLLVGRSTPVDGAPAFGWGQGSGDVLDDSAPYSLGLLAYKFPASELLVGEYTRGKQLGPHAYALTTPPGFPVGFADVVGPTSDVHRVLGDCDLPGGPFMLKYIGLTEAGDRFRFRDLLDAGDDDIYGLYPGGFTLNGDNCISSGRMDKAQGLVFVR